MTTANKNSFVPGQVLTIFIADHHTFKLGDKVKVHASHEATNEYIRVEDPTDPSEFWVLEFADVVPPSPEELAWMEDEAYVCMKIKVGKKRYEVTKDNFKEVIDELNAELLDRVTAIRIIRDTMDA